MIDDSLTMYAGRVMGYGPSDLRFFVPIDSDRQTAELAKKLALHISIDYQAGITRIEHRRQGHDTVIIDHSEYHGDTMKAIRHGVLNIAAEIGRALEPVFDKSTLSPKARKSRKVAVETEALAVG